MGPDGAKGDRGEPTMTVSASSLLQGSIWKCCHHKCQHTERFDIGVVFTSAFCSFSVFILNPGGWGQRVCSIRDATALRWVFHTAYIADLKLCCASDVNQSIWVIVWAKLCESRIEKEGGRSRALPWLFQLTFIILFLFSSCPSVWSSACGGEWAIGLQQRGEGWTDGLWFSLSHSRIWCHICCYRLCSQNSGLDSTYL